MQWVRSDICTAPVDSSSISITIEFLCFGFFIFPEVSLCNTALVFSPLILIVAVADLPMGVDRLKNVFSFFLFNFAVLLGCVVLKKHRNCFL